MIRQFVPDDRDCAVALLVATGNFSPAEIAVAEGLIDTISTQPAQTDYYAFVNTNALDEIVGFLILGPACVTIGSWYLYWIAVHPRCHGTGVAQELDALAQDFVRARGGYWLIAETSGQISYARARNFYAKQGYQELARIPDFYKPADDMIMFGKRFAGHAPL